MGVFIGVLVGIAGLLFYQGHLPQITKALYAATWGFFGLVILTFLIFFGLKAYLTRAIFGAKIANAGDVLEDAQRVSDVITERVADKLLADLTIEERSKIKNILPRLANWFIWGRLRNWWWQWILGIFVALGGITGTMLLMNQNELLEVQNIKIDSQTELMNQQMLLSEASRRSALIVLMSNIMDKVDDEIKEQKSDFLKKGFSKAAVDTMKFSLSQSLIGQIAALSHSFKPYRYMEGDTWIERPLSPERGQLVITLTLLPLDTATLNKIYQSATFREADLQNAVLEGAYLSGAYMIGTDLNGADLNDVNLSRASLTSADLSNTSLHEANLSEAILDQGAGWEPARLTGARLLGANLSGAYLSGADLSGADLSGANLSEADLSGADLSGANLREARLFMADLSGAFLGETDYSWLDLGEADLREADLEETDLREADLSINQLSQSKNLFECRNLHDSLKLPLQQSHPQLFQKPKEE